MAWFTGSSSKPENDTNSSFREDRSKCWEARDAYFACLDAAEVIVAGTEGSKCAVERKGYEQNCAKSWVSLYIDYPLIVLKAQRRSTILTSVAYWLRSKSLCWPKQQPRQPRQEDDNLQYVSFLVHHFPLILMAQLFPAMKDTAARHVQYTSSYSRYCIIHHLEIDFLLTSLFIISLALDPSVHSLVR